MSSNSYIASNVMQKARNISSRWIVRLFLIVVAFITLYPVAWNIYSAFKTNAEFLGNPFSLPSGFEWDNFIRASEKVNILASFANSLFVVAIATAVLIVCVIPCAYCLGRYKFFGAKPMLSLYMIAIFIQSTYIMIPLYLQLLSFGDFLSIKLIDNLVVLGILYAATQFPFSIFLMTGFMRTIPKDYTEAAMIDGCSNFRILTQVIGPMAKPGIVTVCMLSAMAAWNEYPLALVLLSEANYTLPVGLQRLYEIQRYATDWGALFAALTIVLVPTIIMFALGQRYLIEGISAGGLKG